MAAFIWFHVQDAHERPIAGAHLDATSAFGGWHAVTNACGDFFTPAPGLAAGHYDVTVSAPGYTTRMIPMDLGDSGPVIIGLDSASGPLCAGKVPQQPLPPWDASDSGGQVHTTPPPELVIPPGPDPLFLRCDFAGLTLNTARWGGDPPLLVGANTTPRSMLLSPMLHMYPEHWIRAYLTEHCERGYTHFVTASAGWNMPENGWTWTPDAFGAWCRRLTDGGQSVIYWGSATDADDAFINAALHVNALAWYVVGEELDGKMTAEQLNARLDDLVARYPPSLNLAAHFTANYPDGFPRDTMLTNWSRYDGRVHLFWQANQTQSAGTQGAMLYYARRRVNLGEVGGDGIGAPSSRVYAFETMATAQLYGKCDEAYGNLRSLELLYCPRGPNPQVRPVAGFGNGCRYPDGTAL